METGVFLLEGSGYGGWIQGWGNRVGTGWGSLGILLSVNFFGLFGYKHELPNLMEKICFLWLA